GALHLFLAPEVSTIQEKDVVATETPPLAVNFANDERLVFGLARRMVDGEVKAAPMECFPVAEPAVHARRLIEATWGTCPRGRRRKHVCDAIKSPTLRPKMALQVWDAAHVIIVDVRRDNKLDVLYAIVFAELLEVVFDETHGPLVIGVGAPVQMAGGN
ncbi:hypothetical protein O7A70_33895, partial [Mesorhizobium sp. Cs1299R1N1]